TQTFGAVLNTVGTQSLTTADTVDTSITGTQDGIEVVGAATPQTSSPHGAEMDPATGAVWGAQPAAVTPAGVVNQRPHMAPAASVADPAGPARADQAASVSQLVVFHKASTQTLDSLFAAFTGNVLPDGNLVDAVLAGAVPR